VGATSLMFEMLSEMASSHLRYVVAPVEAIPIESKMGITHRP
jgi:hypothetical protein